MTEEKIPTHLEAVSQLVTEGENTILKTKQDIVKLEAMDRWSKRLLLRGKEFENQAASTQQQLAATKQALTKMETAQEVLLSLQKDMLDEESKGATLEEKGT